MKGQCSFLTKDDLDLVLMGFTSSTILDQVPYAGKFWRGKILANLAINANSPNFFPANTYKDTETAEDLPLDPPKFSSPFASTVAIR